MATTELAILLVSDRPACAAQIRTALRAADTDPARVLTWVRTPHEAGVELAARDFDGALLDLTARDLGPLDALTAHDRAVPVIVLVGTDDTGLAHEALRRGAQDHLPEARLDGRLLLRSVEYAGERRRARAELRRTEHLYRSVVGALAEGVLVYSASGRIQTANDSAVRILGLSLDDVTGLASGDPRWQPVREDGTPFPADDLPPLASLRTGEAVTGTVLGVTTAGGGTVWLEAHATPLVADPGERPYGVVVSFRDITARRAAEQAVRDNEAALHLQAEVLHAVGQAVIVTDPAGRVRYANPAADLLHGWAPGTALGRDVTALLPPDLVTPEAVRTLRSGGTWSAEYTVHRPDGAELRLFVNLTPMLSADGTVLAIIGIGTDLTERARAEDAARRLSAIVESSDAAIVSQGPDGTIRSWNRAASRLYGYEPEEAIGRHVSMLAPPDALAAFEEVLARLRAGETIEHLETVRRGRDGTLVDIALTLSPIEDTDGHPAGFSSISRDITERKRLEAEAQEDRRRLAEAQRLAQLGSFELDLTDRTMRWSAELYRILGVDGSAEPSLAAFLGQVHPDDRPAVDRRLRAVLDEGDTLDAVYRLARTAEVCWVHLRAQLHTGDGPARVTGTVVDVTEQRRMADERRAAEDRLRSGFEQAAVGIMLIDADCRMTMVNPAVRALLGRPEQELVGHPIDEFLHVEDRGVALGRFAGLVRGELDSYQAERRYLRPDGSTVWVLVNVSALRDGTGRPDHFFAQMQDITDRRVMEEALEHLAVHDALTQLPNRVLLTDRVQHALDRRGRRTGELAVLFIDIDRFKFVNDGMGHRVGDDLLTVVADRLRATVRPSDTVARFGGDEFVVVCEQLADPYEASTIATRLARAIEEPMLLDGREVVVTASVGIAVAAADATVDALLRDADAAMYRAKERGRARVEVFDEALRGRASERLELEGALRRALGAGEFELAYQPVVRVDTEAVIACEALLRWRHPTRGRVSPAEFIPLAEETGLIVPIGTWVLGEALRQGRAWHDAGREIAIGVNVSARQLMDPGLVDTVAGALRDSGIGPQWVHLEITESVLMDDVEHSIETLTALKGLGVHFAVDDFGTGYSSLSYLRRLPIDTLKIDQSFVRGLGVAENDSIVRAIVGLGRALGMGLLAEGVEEPGQLAALRALGCDVAQGFLWSPAVPAGEFPASVDRS
jgi:diguanylate cyclase (GGDEF)-like protein/PAS domain S-box-containing protein